MTDTNSRLAVEINITRWDLGLLNLRIMIFSKVSWTTGVILALVISWPIVTGHNPPDTFLEGTILLFLLGSFLIAYVLFWAALSALLAIVAANKRSGVLGHHHYEILDEGLRESTTANDSLLRWQGIHALKQLESYLLVFQTPHLVHVLPRRCFEHPADFVMFGSVIREKTKEAAGKSS